MIKGLKGESSFDGSQFPHLPWGGQSVSTFDIQFIEDWIDDGCLEDDAAQAEIERRESRKLAQRNAEF